MPAVTVAPLPLVVAFAVELTTLPPTPPVRMATEKLSFVPMRLPFKALLKLMIGVRLVKVQVVTVSSGTLAMLIELPVRTMFRPGQLTLSRENPLAGVSAIVTLAVAPGLFTSSGWLLAPVLLAS